MRGLGTFGGEHRMPAMGLAAPRAGCYAQVAEARDNVTNTGAGLWRPVFSAALSAVALVAACQSSPRGEQAGAQTSAGVAAPLPVAGAQAGAAAGHSASAGAAAGSGGRSGQLAAVGGRSGGLAAGSGGGPSPLAAVGGAAGPLAAASGGGSGQLAADNSGAAGACAGSSCAGSGPDAGPPSAAGSVLTPDPKYLVAATGPCPDFVNGDVMFMPDGVSRKVLLYIGAPAQMQTMHGPLVFSWHSTIPDPSQANVWLGDSVIADIKAQGGLVAAPYTADPTATRPWDNVPGGPQNTDGDQRLMDEVVACAITKAGIDVRRIHAIGMSAGGLKTAQVSLRRSGYIASVVVYSGGLVEGDMPPDQDPQNLFAAMIFYGGPTDISPVDGIPYTDASRRYLDLITSQGRFGFLCNHNGGHSVPQDSQASAWRFLQDHPFGTTPEPYAKALPAGFPSYCSLNMP
jgi:poly(3-hydroxybutyrate) depolymerase